MKDFAKPDGITSSLLSVSWSPDSKRVVTAGADKVLRIWDRESAAQVCAAKVGNAALEDMQVGVIWMSQGRVISVCVDGRLLIWDIAEDGKATIAHTVGGTQGQLYCVAYDAKHKLLLQSGPDGIIAVTPLEGPSRMAKIGKGVAHILTHSTKFTGPAEAFAFANDDSVRRLSLETGEVQGSPVAVKEAARGVGWLDEGETMILVASSKQNFIGVGSGGVAWTKNGLLPRTPTCMATSPALKSVVVGIEKPDGLVGGVESKQYDIHVFNIAGAVTSADCLAARCVLSGHTLELSSMSFNPDENLLASGDAKVIKVWNMKEETPAKVVNDYVAHTSKIGGLSWIPGSRRFVSGSLDQKVYIWEAGKPRPLGEADGHRGGCSAVVTGLENGMIASVGYDGYLLLHRPA